MMRMLFNPEAPAFIRDPYRFYRVLQLEKPFLKTAPGFYVLTRDREVRAVLNDRRFGRDFQGVTTGGPEAEARNPFLREPAIANMRRWMLVLDPPDHSRIRGLVNKAFSARRVLDLHELVRRIVSETLANLTGRDSVDLMRDFAYVVPQRVICELLGIPESERPGFVANVDGLLRLLDPVPLSRQQLDHANGQDRTLTDYFRRLFERRRRDPLNDLTTHLVQAEEAGDKLRPEELTANMIMMFVAGFETTANTIGNGLLALFQNPAELARLRADFSLMPNAVEEILRYDSAVQFTTRTALEDANLGDLPFRKTETAIVVLAAANRDPHVYHDTDRFDITRKNIKPLSFGGGIHHCVGNQLARLEAEIALTGLLQTFPNLKLANPQNPQFRKSIALRGLRHLPATLQS
jgi:cytochrome P450